MNTLFPSFNMQNYSLFILFIYENQSSPNEGSFINLVEASYLTYKINIITQFKDRKLIRAISTS